MDGKGAWHDNVFVERLWRTLKYEEVYLRAYTSVSEARISIGRYLGFYNGTRSHSPLGGQRPIRLTSTNRRPHDAEIHSAAARKLFSQTSREPRRRSEALYSDQFVVR